jgi:hypothetical protein
MHPQMQQQMYGQNKQQMEESLTDTITNLVYSSRESFVLLLLICIILSPQMNNILGSIPNTMNLSKYPNQYGILIRSVLLVSIYMAVQKLKLI